MDLRQPHCQSRVCTVVLALRWGIASQPPSGSVPEMCAGKHAPAHRYASECPPSMWRGCALGGCVCVNAVFQLQDAVTTADGQPGVQQLQAMLEEFLVDVEASLANGTLQALEAGPAGSLEMQEQQALLAHLRLERDVLLSRLVRFEQVQATSQCCFCSPHTPV